MKTAFFLANEVGLLFEFALEISEAVAPPQNRSASDAAQESNARPRTTGELQYQIVEVSKEPLSVIGPDQTSQKMTDGIFSASHDSYIFAFEDGSVNMVNRWTKKIHKVKISAGSIRRLREEDREASLFFMSSRP